MECRLAAILADHAVGYTHLMGADGAGTFAALKVVCGESTNSVGSRTSEERGVEANRQRNKYRVVGTVVR